MGQRNSRKRTEKNQGRLFLGKDESRNRGNKLLDNSWISARATRGEQFNGKKESNDRIRD